MFYFVGRLGTACRPCAGLIQIVETYERRVWNANDDLMVREDICTTSRYHRIELSSKRIGASGVTELVVNDAAWPRHCRRYRAGCIVTGRGDEVGSEREAHPLRTVYGHVE